jgi:hypothetical protein
MTIQDSATPQLDQNGNPLPAQGAAPGAPPPSPIVSGAPDLATAVAQAFLKHTAQIAQNSTVAQSARAAEAQKALASATPAVDRPVDDDNQASAPGSFASKLTGALGDAAHATDRPGGWLSGVVNTLNAKNVRLAQEQKDAVLMAKSQAENIALHRNFYQQDLQHRQQFQEGNKAFFSQYRESNDVQDGVSQEEVMDRMKKDKNFPKDFLVRATGEVPVADKDGKEKIDQFGNPVMKPTFSIMTVATKDGSDATKTIDGDESAAYNKLLGMRLPAGTKLTMAQDNALSLKLAAARDNTNILTKVNGGKELSPDVMASIRPLITDPTVGAALAAVPGKPYDGIVQHMQNADAHLAVYQQQAKMAKEQNNQQALDAANAGIKSVQEERQKLQAIVDQAIPDKEIEAYNKKADDATSMITDLQKKADAAHGEEAAALAASTKKMLEDGQYTDSQKKILGRIAVQAQTAADASLAFEEKKEKNKAEATNALAEGDTDTLVAAAENYQLDPNKLYSMRKNTNAEFKAKLLAKDPTWSETTYKQRYAMNQELASDKPNSMGGQVESLNRFAYHTGEANRSIEGLRNIGSPIVNTALNKIKAGTVGFEEAQAFKIKAETAKDEFLNFIKNGHVPPTDQEERLAASINENRTPAELQSSFRAMAELAAARAKAMNGRYNTIMGKGNIPGLLSPDTTSILSQFGVDVNAITNTTGTSSFSRAINPGSVPNNQPPKNAVDPTKMGKAVDGTPVWLAKDGSVVDAQGNVYVNGKRQQ